ncbi:MAG TPA: protein kinase [Gemmatimonadaceae bacterium]|nr:protein kinase [Gemmatimonadaceae bacterium]
MSQDSIRDQLQKTLGAAYRLDRELGGGGMSRVFVAEETVLSRTVVIKLLSPELSEGLNVERFRREIQVAARLQHPHIVPLLTAGESGGLPYFTMPFIQGESLRQRLITSGEFPVSEAVRVLREVASALAYAHAAGVVHRDIKPENILISGGAAMVTDFGVAKALKDAANTGGAQLTQFGVALGTPAYMAPEQAAADPTTDQRADIYAFGVMAYELLTGSTPFAGRPAQALLAAHAVEQPEPISRRRPATPEPLAALIMHCLEKRPADRPQTADQIMRALDGVQTSSGGWTPTGALPAKRSASRGKRTILIAAAVVLALAVSVPLLQRRLGASHPASGPVMLAVLPFENEGPSADAYFADGLTEAITNRLASLHNLGVIDRRSAEQYKTTTKTPKQIGRELGVQYILEGTVRWATDEKGTRKVQISPALVTVSDLTSKPVGGPYLVVPSDVFQVQTDVATKVADALNVTLTGADQQALTARPTQDTAAWNAFTRAEQAFKHVHDLSATGALDTALTQYQVAVTRDPKFAQAWARLAFARMVYSLYNPSDTTRLTAAKHALDTAAVLSPDLPELHESRAFYLSLFEHKTDASYEELIRAQAGQPNNADLSAQIAAAEIARGRPDEGFANLAKAVRLDPRSTDALTTAAGLTYAYRRYAESEAYADRLIALDPTLGAAYDTKINDELDGRGDTVAAAHTMDSLIARGVRIGASLSQQMPLIGGGYRTRFEHMTLADIGAGSAFDTLNFYFGKRALYQRVQPALAQAYADSILRTARSPMLTGPLAWFRSSIQAFGYAAKGDRLQAMRALTRVHAELAADKGVTPSDSSQRIQNMAATFAILGDADSAAVYVAQAFRLPGGFSKFSVRLDPTFDPVRNSPAFQRLLQ